MAAGQLVEIVFTNPDAMQHNFVLGAAGSLEAIGAAADKLATVAVPASRSSTCRDIPQVLFSTKLVEPGETVDGSSSGRRRMPAIIRISARSRRTGA